MQSGNFFILFAFAMLLFSTVKTQNTNCTITSTLWPKPAPSQNDDDDVNAPSAPARIMVTPYLSGGSCLRIDGAPGVTLGNVGFLLFSSPSPVNTSTMITVARANGLNISSHVTITNYSPGSEMVCVNRAGCTSLPVPRHTSKERREHGQVAVCLSCSAYGYNMAPVEVCFNNIPPQTFFGSSVTVSVDRVTGWSHPTCELHTSLPVVCDSDAECLPLDAVIVCDKQCEGRLPLGIRTAASGNNTVCVGVFPTRGVTISEVHYLTLSGNSNPLLNTNSSIVSARNGWNKNIGHVWLENYMGGRICATPTCKGYDISEEVHIGDINVCLACNNKHKGDDDDDDKNKVSAPLEVCFSRPGLREVDFENAIIKVEACGVEGFCGMHSITTVAVLQCKGSSTNVVGGDEEECDEEEEEHNQPSGWDDDQDEDKDDNDWNVPPPSNKKKVRRVIKKEVTMTYYSKPDSWKKNQDDDEESWDDKDDDDNNWDDESWDNNDDDDDSKKDEDEDCDEEDIWAPEDDVDDDSWSKKKKSKRMEKW